MELEGKIWVIPLRGRLVSVNITTKLICPEDISPVVPDLCGPCLALPFHFYLKSPRHSFLLILPPRAHPNPLLPSRAPRSPLHMRLSAVYQAMVASPPLHNDRESMLPWCRGKSWQSEHHLCDPVEEAKGWHLSWLKSPCGERWEGNEKWSLCFRQSYRTLVWKQYHVTRAPANNNVSNRLSLSHMLDYKRVEKSRTKRQASSKILKKRQNKDSSCRGIWLVWSLVFLQEEIVAAKAGRQHGGGETLGRQLEGF